MNLPLFFFISVAMLAESVMSLAIPRSIKHSPLWTFSISSSYVIVPEVALYSVFITAILFSIVGAFVLAVVGSARAASFINQFPRSHGDTTLRNAIRRLPLFLSPSSTVADGAGRVAAARRVPTRRGGVAYPMSALRSSRWYQSQSSHRDTSIV